MAIYGCSAHGAQAGSAQGGTSMYPIQQGQPGTPPPTGARPAARGASSQRGATYDHHPVPIEVVRHARTTYAKSLVISRPMRRSVPQCRSITLDGPSSHAQLRAVVILHPQPRVVASLAPTLLCHLCTPMFPHDPSLRGRDAPVAERAAGRGAAPEVRGGALEEGPGAGAGAGTGAITKSGSCHKASACGHTACSVLQDTQHLVHSP